MDIDERNWYIGLGVIVGFSYLVVLFLFFKELYQHPARQAKRKEIAKKKKAKEEIDKINRVNLDGRPILELTKKYHKIRKSNILYQEYRAIVKRQSFKKLYVPTKQEAKLNLSKISVPYINNRVILDSRDHRGWIEEIKPTEFGKSSNKSKGRYINASWIKSYSGPTYYIAAQVPLVNTIHDFWEMVWGTNCHIIVSIGEKVTHSKVYDYLQRDFRRLRVQYYDYSIINTQERNGYVKRFIKFTNKYNDGSVQQRTILNISFPTWTLTAMPSAPIIIEARNEMMSYLLSKQELSPIVVHCITGSSRTGTFISICNILDTIDLCKSRKENQKISWGHVVIDIREQRINSVSSAIQYISIFDTMCHYILSGWTHFPVIQLAEYTLYHSVTMETGKKKFEKQFENLENLIIPIYLNECAAAIRTENISKNRDCHIIPRDANRPYLERNGSDVGSDYINAVYVDGYRNKNQFIVTEWPQKHTLDSVWRLVFEKDVQIIVLMSITDDNKFPRFWSNTKAQKVGYGKICVQLLSDDYLNENVRIQSFYLQRMIFKLNETERRKVEQKIKITSALPHDQHKTVVMMHLLNWRESRKLPNNLSDFTDLVSRVKRANQSEANSNYERKPILVISHDGYSRIGMFCSTMICLERMESTGQLDVFNAVAKVKKNRPKLVPNLSEYLLIYEMCQEFINEAEEDDEFNDISLD